MRNPEINLPVATVASVAMVFVGLCGVLLLASCQREPESTAPPVSQSAAPVTAVAPVSSGRRLTPVDDASKDSSFLKFREDLLRAVERHDAGYVLSILAPTIRNSFGGNDGIDGFKEMWKPESADSELWQELRFILTHGGTFSGGIFCGPYIYSSFPGDLPDSDEYQYGAVLNDNVLLRSKPDVNALPVATLSYHIVKTAEENGLPSNWMKVSTTDGIFGYLPASAVRNPVDYRACFEKQSGVWRMNVLVAGD